jgi:hypothetical protein
MRSLNLTIIVLLATLQGSLACAASVYRWLDGKGQVHLSDHPPDHAIQTDKLPQQQPSRKKTGTDNLRPAEKALLLQMEKRSQQQAKHAQARKLQNDRKRAEQLERCKLNREKLHAARRNAEYKQYSRYLRNHCW